jgi:murein DD-endopeptidase MepM/ murein hydrolase activator NlpD
VTVLGGGGVVAMSIRKALGAAGLLVALAAAAAAWNLARERPALPLCMPVAGFEPSQVHSSFGAPRSGGRRRHHGVDLFAPRGASVRAATSGVVLFVGTNELGGRIVYVLGEGLLTYYAHLDAWAARLHVGQRVRRGTLLGQVGDSGNARGTPCHLHFAAHPIWKWGRPVDPAPWLVAEVR